jgi:hypothetical protein
MPMGMGEEPLEGGHMKLEITTAVLAGTLALAAPAAFAERENSGTEAFAPNGEEYTHDQPTPRAKPKTIEHVIKHVKKSGGVAKPGANGAAHVASREQPVKVGARKEMQ